MPNCSACGSPNSDQALFCQACGRQLQTNSPIQPGTIEQAVPPSQPAAMVQPQYPPTLQTTYPPANQPYYGVSRPPKQKSTGMILEILPGLFGLYGFGRIYAGDTQTGVIWLVAGLIWSFFAVMILVLTGGIGAFCTLPVNIACVVICATTLNTYMNKHPELFGV